MYVSLQTQHCIGDCLVAQSLVQRQFVEYKSHRYTIQQYGTTAGDVTVAAAAAAADDDDDDDRRERSVLVKHVPADLVDAVVCLMESDRKGGGAIELQKRDCYTGSMLFTFLSKDGQCCRCCAFCFTL